jgi:hypothetical protein
MSRQPSVILLVRIEVVENDVQCPIRLIFDTSNLQAIDYKRKSALE